MRYEYLISHDKFELLLQADHHFKASKLVQRVDDVDVVVQVNATVVHEYEQTPEIGTMLNPAILDAKYVISSRQLVNTDLLAQRLDRIDLVPVVAGE